MYDTSEEAKQKLASSVVLYKGSPVWVRDAYVTKTGGEVILIYKTLPISKPNRAKIILGDIPPEETVKKDQLEAPISDSGWDFKTIGSRLGYVNVQGQDGKITTAFCSRIPTRHSRQGLDNRTVKVDSETGESFENLIHNESLVETMRGTFQSFKEAFSNLTKNSDKFKSIAVGRKMNMSWDRVTPPVLFYRGDKIGYTEDGSLFKLASHKQFLKEELQDMEGLKIAQFF